MQRDAFGQGGTVSPYSRYGLGDLQFGGLTTEIAMGGISAGIRNPSQINYSNPASYSSIRYTTFEAGIKAQAVDFASQNISGKSNSVSLSYLALAFPLVKNKWGASFGLIPFSDIGYKIKQSEIVDPIGQVDYLFEGSGGINRFYIGTAVSLLKNLSVGINASYLFGTLQRTRKIEFPNQLYFFNTQSNASTYLHDFYFNYGVQYIIPLKKEQQLTLGLSGALASKIRTNNDLITYNYVVNFAGFYTLKDTIEEFTDNKGQTILPVSLTGGLVYKKGAKWVVGADFSFQNWSKFESFGVNDSLNDSYRLSVGAQLTPDYSSLNLLRRMQYRAGVKYAQTYLKLKDTPLFEYSLNLGFGIPIKVKSAPRVLPSISLAIEAGQRGTTNDFLLRERFLRFHIGITISEEWFIPRKFD